MRVAETGLTMAEYFRDEEHQNVLLLLITFPFCTGRFRGIRTAWPYAFRSRLPADSGQ